MCLVIQLWERETDDLNADWKTNLERWGTMTDVFIWKLFWPCSWEQLAVHTTQTMHYVSTPSISYILTWLSDTPPIFCTQVWNQLNWWQFKNNQQTYTCITTFVCRSRMCWYARPSIKRPWISSGWMTDGVWAQRPEWVCNVQWCWQKKSMRQTTHSKWVYIENDMMSAFIYLFFFYLAALFQSTKLYSYIEVFMLVPIYGHPHYKI